VHKGEKTTQKHTHRGRHT